MKMRSWMIDDARGMSHAVVVQDPAGMNYAVELVLSVDRETQNFD
jgi:hypothetical protein